MAEKMGETQEHLEMIRKVLELIKDRAFSIIQNLSEFPGVDLPANSIGPMRT